MQLLKWQCAAGEGGLGRSAENEMPQALRGWKYGGIATSLWLQRTPQHSTHSAAQ